MSQESFVHLHVHSDYSLLDGACRIDKLVARAVELGMPALAVTDHGNLFGAIEFYKAAKKAKLKPIIGCEAYITSDDLRKKEKAENFHLTLLVRNAAGYKNLVRLNTIAHQEGFYYKPRIDLETLEKHAEGLIALSGCISGQISRAALSQNADKAQLRKLLDRYRGIFGAENFFLEVHRHGMEEEKIAEQALVELARETGCPLVAANDAHYINKADALAHEVLLCIQTGATLSDADRMRFPNQEFYLKSPQEMRELYWDLPEAVENTLRIAEMCQFDMPFNQSCLPRFEPPAEKNTEEYLTELCLQGLKNRYPEVTPAIRQRLDYELSVISKMGFVSYFLIVWDFVNYARENGIPVGPGRGSAAGSLVSYALGITNVDPLAYDLLFERFLNPERVSMPDIDIDFCYEQREKVIQHVIQKYGRDHVSQIVTFGTLGAKAVVRDVGRVLGMSYGEVDAIAKLVPSELDITLKDAFAKEPELKKACDNAPQVKRLFDIAFTLEGLVRNMSTHAAGIVISDRPLTEIVPLARGANGEMCTQFSKDALEETGLLKMDFLGLRTLTVINECLDIIKRVHGREIDIDRLDLTDKKTYEMLARGDTIGVFQLESGGMQDALIKMEIENFDELQSVLALYRPGPMKFIPDFISRKKGETQTVYDHPRLEPVLKSTYGIMVYQEQVMQCANVIAGYSLGEADILRRIMGKKKVEEMEKQKDIFIKGAVNGGIAKDTAVKIFETMAYFANYGFNKSHSTAYAMVAYQTAWLKANYPVEFMAAIMSNEMVNPDRLARLLSECRDLGIPILPPDINESFTRFSVVANGEIRFGFSAIKNVGRAASDHLIEVRLKDGPFRDLVDFVERVDSRIVNRKVMESLIKAGGFDRMHKNRAALMAGLDQLMRLSSENQRDKDAGQISMFEVFDADETFKREEFVVPQAEPWDKNTVLAHEKELLGFYVSGNPLDEYRLYLKCLCDCNAGNIESFAARKRVTAGGIIRSVRVSLTKSRGEKMAVLSVEDGEGSITVVIYPQAYQAHAELIREGEIIVVQGDISDRDSNTVLANDVRRVADTYGFVAAVCLTVPSAFFEDGRLEKLVALCGEAPGITPLYFSVSVEGGKKAMVRCSDQMGVTPGPVFFQQLEKLLGREQVTLKTNFPVVFSGGRDPAGRRFNGHVKAEAV